MSNHDLPVLAMMPSHPQPMMAPVIPQHYAHPGLSFAQLWAIVRAYRRFTLTTLAVAIALAIVVTKLMPKTYEATATLMVDYEINDPLGGRDFPVGLMGSYMSTQTQLIRSPAVLFPAIQQLGLHEDPEIIENYEGDPSRLLEWIRNNMSKELTVEQGDWGSQLIYITYAADDAAEAARVANTVADVYAEQQFTRLTGPAAEREQRYTTQLEELRQNVDKAQQALTDFRQKTGLLDSDTRVDLELERLADLEGKLSAAQEQRRMAELRRIGDPNSRDATLAANSIQGFRSSLAQLKTQLAQLRTSLGPRHPQVIEIQTQIEATQQALDAEMQVYEGNTSTQITAARSLETQLKKAVEAQRAKVLEKRRLQNESARYERELQTAQTLYQSALDGYDQVVLASGSAYNNVQFVSRATAPAKASQPKPLINLAVALMLGAFIGVAGPIVRELLNRRVRCRDDLDRDFGIPVLAEFSFAPAHPIHQAPDLAGAR